MKAEPQSEATSRFLLTGSTVVVRESEYLFVGEGVTLKHMYVLSRLAQQPVSIARTQIIWKVKKLASQTTCERVARHGKGGTALWAKTTPFQILTVGALLCLANIQ